MLSKIQLFGIGITNSSKEDILEYIKNSFKNPKEKYFIVTPNPELIIMASKNPQYRTVLNQARISLCDGVGLFVASKFLGKQLKERITGVDFVKMLCGRFAKKPITVGLIGGKPGVAQRVGECLRSRYPELQVVLTEAGNPDEQTVQDLRFKIKDLRLKNKNEEIINHKSLIVNHIDILFVAFGSPKQELWISEHLHELPAQVVIGVGGAFDFIAGVVPRAPRFVQSIGLEWLYRLVLQPWRIKRQLALLQFILLALREKIKTN